MEHEVVIPRKLKQEHQDGKVVFFCGAGVSVPAGYPLFKELTEQLIKDNPIQNDAAIQSEIKEARYDQALGQIEHRLGKTYYKFRRDKARRLSLKPKSLEIHKDLLKLATDHDKKTRLVTTNFDRLFFQAAKKLKLDIKIDFAPKLPVSRQERWNSLVHLHGIIPKRSQDYWDDTDLSNLILTSSDLGEAYITESYCTRFVTELMRSYRLVFIGYSLNDPTMKYLLDAISALEQKKNHDNNIQFLKSYIFVGHSENTSRWNKEKVFEKFSNLYIKPIYYTVKSGEWYKVDGHKNLYNVIKNWGEDHYNRDPLAAKISYLQEPHIKNVHNLSDSEKQKVFWALFEESGKVAEAMAQSDSPLDISWLPELAKNGLLDQIFSYDELDANSRKQKGKPPKKEKDTLPYQGSISRAYQSIALKPLTQNLLLWLLRHLDKRELAEWFIKNGGQPHERFCRFYDNEHYDQYKPELNPSQKAFWDILTSHFYSQSNKGHETRYRLYWKSLDLSNPIMREDFLAHIKPVLNIKETLPYQSENIENNDFLNLFEFKVSINDQSFEHYIEELIAKSESDNEIKGLDTLCIPLSHILAEHIRLKQTIITLKNEAGQNEENITDYSHYSLLSIAPHEQNKYSNEFNKLVFLLRESWRQLYKNEPERAIKIAKSWLIFQTPLLTDYFFMLHIKSVKH